MGFLTFCHDGDFEDYTEWMQLRSVANFSLIDRYEHLDEEDI